MASCAAALRPVVRKCFAAINGRPSALSVQIGQNVLAAKAAWGLDLRTDFLAGLPLTMCEAAAGRAAAKGQAGHFHGKLERTDHEGFLTFSERRDFRETLLRAFTTRWDGGPHNNWQPSPER